MKRICLILAVVACVALTPCYAAAQQESQTQQMLSQQYDAANADELTSELPEGVEEALDRAGVESPHPEDMQQFSIFGFFQGVLEQVTSIAKTPFALMAGGLAILLLCALFEAFHATSNSALSGVLSAVSLLAMCGMMLGPLIHCVQTVAAVVRGFGNFMLCFIPVFTSVIATSGCPASSIGYNTALFTISQIISSVMADFLLPFIGIFLAFSVAGSVSGKFKIHGLTSAVKKMIVGTLTLLVTVFVGLFSMQSMVSVASDSLGLKTAKFLSGNFVPVVGSALGDAFSSVMGCMGLIKSSVGGFGVLACLCTFLPSILMVLFFLLALKFTGAVAECLGVSGIPGLMEAVQDALSVLLAFLICFAILIVVTMSIMLVMGST